MKNKQKDIQKYEEKFVEINKKIENNIKKQVHMKEKRVEFGKRKKKVLKIKDKQNEEMSDYGLPLSKNQYEKITVNKMKFFHSELAIYYENNPNDWKCSVCKSNNIKAPTFDTLVNFGNKIKYRDFFYCKYCERVTCKSIKYMLKNEKFNLLC